MRLVLRNGLRVSLHPAGVGDEGAIVDFLGNLSASSRRRRFFSAAVDLRTEAHRELMGEAGDHLGLLAWADGLGLVGHALYVRVPFTARAEVAVEVADELGHLGLATQLVIALAQHAHSHLITRFFAEVLPVNGEMLAVFRDSFETTSVIGPDAIEIEFPTSGWRTARTQFPPAGTR